MNRFDRKISNGSFIIFASVILIDIILANIVYYIIVCYSGIAVPGQLTNNISEGLLAVNFAAIIGETFYSPKIHHHKINLFKIARQVFMMTLTQSLALMALVRTLVDYSQGVMRLTATFFASIFVATMVLRFFERQLLKILRRLGHNQRSVVFIGSDPVILSLYKEMKSSAAVGYIIQGYYANNIIEGAPDSLKHLGTRKELLDSLRKGETPFSCDVLFYSLTATCSDTDVNMLINYCDKNIMQFYLVPRIYSNLSMDFSPMAFGDYTFFTNHTNNINRIDNRIIKRLFDIVFSSIVCICIIPLIPFIWIIVKLQSPGPLFFKQERTGLNGETFLLYKFRSMHVNKDADRLQATKNDPRKFAFGEFMRKTNIDELPQFFNVLKGDMSVVGPRPHMLLHTESYSHVISKYMVRHFSKPGITGWAQITGYRGETSELWQMEERVKRDIWYNENWSFMLDMEIIVRTISQTIFPDEHAY